MEINRNMKENLTTQTRSITKSMITPVFRGRLQRQCSCGHHTSIGGDCDECKNKRQGDLQRVAVNDSPSREVPPLVQEVLNSPGQLLDLNTRAFMEPRFGHDFSGVRVHTDSKAAESAQAVNALAYTVGRNVVFRTGQYAPHTLKGRCLIAHELAHTIQQAAISKQTLHPLTLFDETRNGRVAEMEADHLAARAMASPQGYLNATRTRTPVLQRQFSSGSGVQVRSPVFEEAATQLSDVAGAITGRPLTAGERSLAQSVFGSSIDYGRVRLVPFEALEYRTVANNIYIPPNFTIAREDMAQTLIHELTHVWQYQHGGTSYISIALGSQLAAAISHGNRNFAYDYQIQAGQSFFDFTPEQQGLLVENYFAMQRDRVAIPRDTAAGRSRTYESNHMDISTGFKALLSAADRQNEISRELPLHEPLIRQMRAALPQSEASLLLLRASEVMTTPGQDLVPVPPERQLPAIKPLFELRF